MMKILVCDDEKDIVNALTIYLEADGYAVIPAYNGAEALEKLAAESPALVLMDVMMPGMDGLEAINRLRRTSNIPVILITAKSEDTDKILGLNLGADDYVTKPFNPVELLARVRSQLRRYTVLGGAERVPARYVCGRIELNDETKTVCCDGVPVSLTPTEYNLLFFLMRNPGRVFSSGELYRQVWGDAPLGSEGTVAVHIRHLREKLEINPAEPRYLTVVWGHGYKMEGKV